MLLCREVRQDRQVPVCDRGLDRHWLTVGRGADARGEAESTRGGAGYWGLLMTVSPAGLQEILNLCLNGCGAGLFWSPFPTSIPCPTTWRGVWWGIASHLTDEEMGGRDRKLLTQGITASGTF